MYSKIIRRYRTYLIYFFSILFGRGLEYVSFFIVGYFADKEVFGEFEFYKKIIEFASIFVSFGFPALIITYTKTKEEKINFFYIGIFLSFFLTITVVIVGSFFDKTSVLFLIPILFYSLFHYSNSIYQAFNLVVKGSSYAAKYKSIVSLIFTTSLLVFFYFLEDKSKSIIYSTYPLIFFGFLYLLKDFSVHRSVVKPNFFLKNFKAQFSNSITLFFTTIANTSFLVTDIFVINYLSNSLESKILIASYNFPLMIANALLLIPLTISSVDIEKYKKKHSFFIESNRKNILFVLIASILVFVIYYTLIEFVYIKFKDTLKLFFILLLSKIVQAITIPYGSYLAVKHEYKYALKVLLLVIIINIVFSLLFYDQYGTIGIAIISLLSLSLRFVFYKIKYNHGRNLWGFD